MLVLNVCSFTLVCDCNEQVCLLLEQSLIALRKLTCAPESHLQVSAFDGAIPGLLALCQVSTNDNWTSACDEFARLTSGHQLVGSVSTIHDEHSAQPIYSVDLYDTSGEDDISLCELLVKSGHFRRNVEECTLSTEDVEKFWVSVMVTSRLDEENRFTAQLHKIETVGIDRMLIPIDGGKVRHECLYEIF